MPSVGDAITAEAGAWTFGSGVAERFDSHVVRSLPMYEATHALICDLADDFVPSRSRVYDLGCSTGTLLELLAVRLRDRQAEIVGVDVEPEMLAQARLRCARHPNVALVEADIVDLPLEPAHLVVAHYTLQFIPSERRGAVVSGIHAALRPGGAFLFFEKISGPTAHLDELVTAWYHSWKRSQGFSEEEIRAKAESLVGVLFPGTSATNHGLLAAAGFADVFPVFRWLNWEGLLALR